MTEDEAKTKWCPHVRYAIPSEVAWVANKYDHPVHMEKCMCIASDCMMWEWENEAEYFNSEGGIPAQGYCGLTGAKYG